jgi:putative CocE/NonD family hydrolase
MHRRQEPVLRRLPSRIVMTLAATLALLGEARAQEVACDIEWAPMRDGTLLATEVYRPQGSAPLPVILQRTPYSRFPGALPFASRCDNAEMQLLARSGYVALNQDVRGRYRSQGVMDAMQQEADDGYDAVEWAAARSWSTGKVGMIGGSYVGLTQWQPAIHTPPHLAAIAPLITASDYHDHWTYVNGAFDLWFAQSWMLLTFAGEQLIRNLEAAGLPPDAVAARTAEWTAAGRDAILSDWVWRLPLDTFDEYRRTSEIDPAYSQPLAPYYYDWLAHPDYDAFWAKIDVESRYAEVKVPTLNIGWWYDIFQIGTVRNFQRMQAEGGTAAARSGSKLVMWAQCHACPPGTKAGDIDFGPQNDVNLDALYVRFFDRWLKGIDNGIDTEPAVRIFVMVPPDGGTTGSGFWVESETFPLPGTEVLKWRLLSGGRANGASGDGILARGAGGGAAGARAPADDFVYDPRRPVPTKGGNMCCVNDLLPSGAFDQAEIEQRGDVLVYTSAPLKEDLAVIGPVRVTLWATTSAGDTDFTAKLVDVHPDDGYAQNILDRIVRARYRSGSKLPPSFIEAGKPYEYTIDLGNTSTVFRRGHRIRLEVSSSNFPHYVRNQNTAAPVGSDTVIEIAHQSILHDARHQSVLELPVVPGITAP